MHGYRGYRRGCRCDECRRGNTERTKAARLRRRERLANASVPHGSTSTYNNWGCRCGPCAEANKTVCRENDIKAGRRLAVQQARISFPRVPIPKAMRWEVWERDDFTCQTCGVRRFLSIDHILPVALGGETQLHNLQTLCKPCNSGKRDRVA